MLSIFLNPYGANRAVPSSMFHGFRYLLTNGLASIWGKEACMAFIHEFPYVPISAAEAVRTNLNPSLTREGFVSACTPESCILLNPLYAVDTDPVVWPDFLLDTIQSGTYPNLRLNSDFRKRIMNELTA